MKNYNFIESLRKRISNYQTYYQILGINSDNVTDEIVEVTYHNKSMQLNKMLKDCKNEGMKEIKELIQTTLDDAYTALKTKKSRKHYNELLKTINTSSKSKEAEKIYEENEK